MEAYIQHLFAERIGGSEFGKESTLYKFERIKQAKRDAVERNPGMPLIDLGVGEPDWMADEEAVQMLAVEAGKWENRGYADNGPVEFKESAAGYMKRIYNVEGLNPETEINPCMGSKAALAQLPAAFIEPGDITLMTVPGYPILGTHTEWYGGEVVRLPLHEENQFLPDLKGLSSEIRRRAKLLYVNYPNNPTGATATRSFYEEVVRFAQENQMIVISDEAYGALTFDGKEPLSFLSVPGAKEVGVSIQSLSKSFNMTGWRLGFVAGNELVVKAFAAVKDHCDSGQFLAMQKAGVYCLEHPQMTENTIAKYTRRHRLLASVLSQSGFQAQPPKATFFQYAQAPKGVKGGATFHTAEDFSLYLLREKMISTVPWDDAGKYIRFSVTYVADDENEEQSVMAELRRRLEDLQLVW